MNQPLTIECDIHFYRRDHGRKVLQAGEESPQPTIEPGRVPRVSRLLALAHRFDALIKAGEVAGYSELAKLGHVTPARVSQVMSLLNLAPDIQEDVLFLPRTQRGRDSVVLRDLLPIAAVMGWRQQRKLWQQLCCRRCA
jgi:hypothetical protein